jgi:hypothetical protein
MDLGFKLRRVEDNKKSWVDTDPFLRTSFDGGFNSYYYAPDECLVINVKNVDIMLNPSFGLLYDVYTMSRTYNYPIPNEGLNYVPPSPCNTEPLYPKRGGIDWTEIVPKPKEKTFFEFAQTFWRNMINVRNRQFITDGKTGGYPTLQSIWWKYLESRKYAGISNDNFNYQTMIDYINGLGDYWIRLIEQMVPATTIWNTGVRLENSIFHRQKFVWRRQYGCEIVPIPCNPCILTTQLFAYDCPTQILSCGLYPWTNDPNTVSFGTLLGNVIKQYLSLNNLSLSDCILNTVYVQWYVDLKINGITLETYMFAETYGYQNYPTNQQWLDGLNYTLSNLQNEGYNYFIDLTKESIIVYNVNCNPLEITDTFSVDVGINFTILCNQ